MKPPAMSVADPDKRLTDGPPSAPLDRLSPRLRLAAISATLPHASPAERRVLAAALLDQAAAPRSPLEPLRAFVGRWSIIGRLPLVQPAPDPALLLARCWVSLPEDFRAVARSLLAGRLGALAGTLSSSQLAADRVAAAAVIAGAPHAEPIRLLPALIADADPHVGEAAESTLLQLAQHVQLYETGRAALDGAVASAARDFPTHRRRGVMDAAWALIESAGPRLAAFLAEEDQPAHLALRAAVRRASGPEARARCVRLLGHPLVGPAALDRLLQAAGPPENASSLREWHRLIEPRRARQIARASQPWRSLPDAKTTEQLDETARVALVQWMRTIPLKPARRTRRLELFLADSSHRVRYAAACAVAHDVQREATAADLASDFAFDLYPAVALTAARSLVGAGRAPSNRFWSRLARVREPEVALLARREHRDRDAWAFLDEADPLAHAVAARRLLARDESAAVDGLRGVLTSDASHRSLRAIALARRLGVVDRLEPELLMLASSEDERLAATAVRALGVSASDGVAAALATAARHADGRVRASAIEALCASGAGQDQVIEAVRDEVARVRANAVRAMLKREIEEGCDQLASMLRDDRPVHRVSALWVAERLGGAAHAHTVAELARADSEASVRERAKRCARRLLAKMREQWAGEAREAAIHA